MAEAEFHSGHTDDGDSELTFRSTLSISLHSAFDRESLEDGMDHPAEKIIDEVLSKQRDWDALPALREICLNKEQSAFAASVLRCLCRNSRVGTNTWRSELIRDALKTDNLAIRDAAIQAAEHWGGHRTLAVLKQHTEPTPWLRDYLQDVIKDISV